MTPRIRKAKALNPGPSRRERRQKKDAKAGHKERVSRIFAEAAAKYAGTEFKRDTEPPERPPKPRKQQPAWMVKREQARLSWSWKANG